MSAYLLLDTNALPKEGTLESGFWSALFRLCEAKDIRPAISEVTLHEAVNMRREAANTVLKPFAASHTQLSRMIRMDAIYTPTGDQIAELFQDRLVGLFEILPLDGEHAREALRREAHRIAPARRGSGGRDSAIWLTVAALSNAGHEVYFVTRNSKDFGRGGLYTELLAEVEGAPHPIQYFSSSNEFVEKIATSVDLPMLTAESIRGAFEISIRSDVIAVLEELASVDHTVDRAVNADVLINDVRGAKGYIVEGKGLAYVNASMALADPSGVQWATGRIEGWLNFEPGSLEALESEVERISDLEFR
ncbi:PIN domain-containing protein [Cellulosimicrobium cellulans]|uniref:PIN domain-containing protein n=1 Tax=Cellulosimicrobium cellulans TaxID=1710 RepID=UPI00301AD081